MLAVLVPLASACGATASGDPSLDTTPAATVSQASIPSASASPTPKPAVQEQASPAVRSITVEGKAPVLGRETADISISLTIHGADARSALDRSADAIQAVRSIVEGLDVATEVHDGSISEYPASFGSPPTTYRSLSVETPNYAGLSHTLGLLEEQIRGGILQPDESVAFNVTFGIEEGGDAEVYARTRAMSEARTAAEQIAAENGLGLGEILSVVEAKDAGLSAGAPYNGYGGQATEPSVSVSVTFAIR